MLPVIFTCPLSYDTFKESNPAPSDDIDRGAAARIAMTPNTTVVMIIL
jgi:hypothetical protein